MNKLDLAVVKDYVKNNIGSFHSKKISSLNSLKLTKVIKRKNPYLFKAKGVSTASDIVKGIVDAHISSNEEAIFGDWLEGLAIFINEKVYGGFKSGITGIDLEFIDNNIRYIITIKSGPNWGNSSQITKMKENFKTAQKTLRTSNARLNIVCVNGCCYGKDGKPDKGEYFKYCGQEFWHLISNDENLYTDIIEPLGYMAKEKNDEFLKAYSKMLNLFTAEFIKDICSDDGSINWKKLLEFNSKKRT